MVSRVKEPDHCRLMDNGKTFYCPRCGAEHHVVLPMVMAEYAASALAFSELHSHCREPGEVVPP